MTLADNLRDVVKSIHRDDVLLCAVKSQRGHQREKGGPVFFGGAWFALGHIPSQPAWQNEII